MDFDNIDKAVTAVSYVMDEDDKLTVSDIPNRTAIDQRPESTLNPAFNQIPETFTEELLMSKKNEIETLKK